LALSTFSNFSVFLAILFGKLEKTPTIAEATLGVGNREEEGDSNTTT
jgi:hypothetical protein